MIRILWEKVLDFLPIFVYNTPVMMEETVDILEYNRIALKEELNMFIELLGDI